MIRYTLSKSAQQAKDYYTSSLSKSDYYTNDTELPGQFRGLLAERLGIEGEVTRDVFFELVENRNPVTGENLTPRTTENRRVGIDINFHSIKEASILNALAKDNHIQDAFMDSVRDTMKVIEADIMTRVRTNNTDFDRKASGLIWGEFTHLTSRPTKKAVADMHLHCHCFVINASYCPIDDKIKAGQFGEINRSMPYYQARFNKIFSDRLSDLGYNIKKTSKAFTIEGVPPDMVDLFSKRKTEVEKFAKDHGVTDRKQLDALGAKTRSQKDKGLTMAELKQDWRRQIKESGILKDGEENTPIRYAPKKEISQVTAKDSVDYSTKFSFERASVKEERRILAEAYNHSIGSRSVSMDDIDTEFKNDSSIIRVEEKGRMLCTNIEVLREEKEMVTLARNGKGKFSPLYSKLPEIKSKGQHARAIEHVLTTKDQVSIIMGAAGAGKTTLMKELVPLIESTNTPVMLVAPSSQASRGVLKSEGFDEADTVSRLLVDKKQQDKLQNGVLIVDEAGTLSVKQATALLTLVNQKNARLLYCGDSRQHNSVERGDALRVINKIAGIRAAEVNIIHRQRDLIYREAVQDLAKGQVGKAFKKLDDMGAIKEIDPLNPNAELVADYVATIKSGKTALIVSPTHKQGNAVTAEIREKLRDIDKIGKKEIAVAKFTNINMTEAERSDWRNFKEGQAVQFTQNVPGIKKGSMWSVNKISEKAVILNDKDGKTQNLPLTRAKDFTVYQPSEIGLSKGDLVRITNNSFDERGKRMDNGTSLKVASVNKAGKTVLINPTSKGIFTVDRGFGHIAHDYCTTSHSSQGKTTDLVLVAQNSQFGDAKQFYVSVSRGRDGVAVYTDDKEQLLMNVEKTGDRQSAIELTHHLDNVILQERTKIIETRPKTPERTKQSSIRKETYEPEF